MAAVKTVLLFHGVFKATLIFLCHGIGKTGNLVLTFSRQGKHREFCSDTRKNLLTQGKYLDCDYEHKKYVYFLKF